MSAVTIPVPAAATRRPILVASNVLISDRDEILFGQRADTGLWEVPGGKVEAEFVIDGGKREMREETGIELLGTPVVLGYADTWDTFGVGGGPWYVCVMLLWQRWSGFPQLLEGKHREWKWFPLTDLPDLHNVTAGTRTLLTNLLPPYLAGYAATNYPGGETAGPTDTLPFVRG